MELTFRSGGAASLWSAGIQSVYLFCGEEDRLKSEAVQALQQHVVDPDFADFDLEQMNGSSATPDAILAAAGQAPFGSAKRLVVVKDLEQWRDRGRQADADRLAEGLARLPETCCLALVVAAEEEEGRRKTAVTTKLDNAVKKLGALVACK